MCYSSRSHRPQCTAEQERDGKVGVLGIAVGLSLVAQLRGNFASSGQLGRGPSRGQFKVLTSAAL